MLPCSLLYNFFFFQAEDGIRDRTVTGVQTCALPISFAETTRSVLLVVSANVLVFWLLASAAAHGRISLGEAVVYVQSAIGVSMIAFGGFSWALDGAAAPVAAVLRLEPAMRPAGAPGSGDRPAGAAPAREIRLRDITFAYPAGASAPPSAAAPVLQ